MAATPGTFDYFRRGVPSPQLRGRASAWTFDYFRRGVPSPQLYVPISMVAPLMIRRQPLLRR